jgi:hypothetical protein
MKRTENFMTAADKGFRIRFGKYINSKFNVGNNKIKYLSNSSNYPDSVSLTSEDLISGNMFGIIQKNNNGEIVSTYVMSISELISVMNKYHSDSKRLVTKRNQNPEERGILARIPYTYMQSYKQDFN